MEGNKSVCRSTWLCLILLVMIFCHWNKSVMKIKCLVSQFCIRFFAHLQMSRMMTPSYLDPSGGINPSTLHLVLVWFSPQKGCHFMIMRYELVPWEATFPSFLWILTHIYGGVKPFMDFLWVLKGSKVSRYDDQILRQPWGPSEHHPLQ